MRAGLWFNMTSRKSRDHGIEQIASTHRTIRQVAIDLTQETDMGMAELLDSKLGSLNFDEEDSYVLHLLGLEWQLLLEIGENGSSLWKDLLDQTTALQEAYPIPWVFWLEDMAAAYLKEHHNSLFDLASSPLVQAEEQQSEEKGNPYAEMQELSEKIKEGEDTFELEKERAELYMAFNLSQRAYDLFENMKEKADKPAHKADASLGLASILKADRQSEEALDAYQDALEIYEAAEDEEKMGEVYREVALLHMQDHNRDEALEFFLSSLESYKHAGNQKQVAITYRSIAFLQERRGKLEKAAIAFTKAIDAFDIEEDTLDCAKCYQHLGAVRQNQQKWPEALDSFQRALEVARKTDEEFLVQSLEDSVEDMEVKVKKASGKKGFFGKLFG